MRTTLSIDGEVLAAVKDRARREGRTAGQVISELVRQQLPRSGEGQWAGTRVGGSVSLAEATAAVRSDRDRR